MSSDHAGINQELGRLRTELYRSLAKLDDPRHVRDYMAFMREVSRDWIDDYPEVYGRK